MRGVLLVIAVGLLVIPLLVVHSHLSAVVATRHTEVLKKGLADGFKVVGDIDGYWRRYGQLPQDNAALGLADSLSFRDHGLVSLSVHEGTVSLRFDQSAGVADGEVELVPRQSGQLTFDCLSPNFKLVAAAHPGCHYTGK